MADNELAIKGEDIVPIIEKGGIESAIKPLIDEIHLFDTYIAGTSFLKDLFIILN